MNVGDKVRLIRGTEEGVIVKIDGNKVYFSDVDGFEFQCFKNDLAVVHQDERRIFRSAEAKIEISNRLFSSSGVFFALKPGDRNMHDCYLVNNTDVEVIGIVTACTKSAQKQLKSFKLAPRATFHIQSLEPSQLRSDFSYWIEALMFHQDSDQKPKRFEQSINPSSLKTEKSLETSQLLQDKAYLLQVDVETKKISSSVVQKKEEFKPSLDIQRLKDAMTSSNPVNESDPVKKVKKPSQSIDLHAEHIPALKENPSIKPIEYLKYQFEYFEKILEEALVHENSEIIFIHGTGNGILRDMIHKHLSKQEGRLSFKDAQRDRFGSYGATHVFIES